MHVDMDAFYAAVEARQDPALRDWPLVVGADPKEGHSRGVVTATSSSAVALAPRGRLPRRCRSLADHVKGRRPGWATAGEG